MKWSCFESEVYKGLAYVYFDKTLVDDLHVLCNVRNVNFL